MSAGLERELQCLAPLVSNEDRGRLQTAQLGEGHINQRLALEREEPKGHTNKLGQAYGSYRD